jgi:hypothetical protein
MLPVSTPTITYHVSFSRKSTIALRNVSFGSSSVMCKTSIIEFNDPLSLRFNALMPLDLSCWSVKKQMSLPSSNIVRIIIQQANGSLLTSNEPKPPQPLVAAWSQLSRDSFSFQQCQRKRFSAIEADAESLASCWMFLVAVEKHCTMPPMLVGPSVSHGCSRPA